MVKKIALPHELSQCHKKGEAAEYCVRKCYGFKLVWLYKWLFVVLIVSMCRRCLFVACSTVIQYCSAALRRTGYKAKILCVNLKHHERYSSTEARLRAARLGKQLLQQPPRLGPT
jgi:hypothetical protein